MPTKWNPTQYERFKNYRERPGLDLIEQINIQSPKKIVDLGCGTGYLADTLAKRYPQADILGIDSSQDMLDKAAKQYPNILWQQGDISKYQGEGIDLLFSNAALHWVEPHQEIFPRLIKSLNPGGCFACQMPTNFSEPTHTRILETIKQGPWKEQLLPLWRGTPTQDAEFYYHLLQPLSSEINLWETTFYQILTGDNPVAEWVKGSWLQTFLSALAPEQADEFFNDYAARVAKAYPKQANGETLVSFRRLFFIVNV